MICFHLQKSETLAMYVLTTNMISHHSMTLPKPVQKGLSWHGEAQRSKSDRADRVPELPPSAKTAEGISSSLWGASSAIETCCSVAARASGKWQETCCSVASRASGKWQETCCSVASRASGMLQRTPCPTTPPPPPHPTWFPQKNTISFAHKF